MHARIDQLLSQRDGEPVDVNTVRHIESCARCSSDLERLKAVQLRLQSLPSFDPPALSSMRPAWARGRLVVPAAIAAACVLAIAIGIAQRDRVVQVQVPESVAAAQQPSMNQAEPLDTLVAQSRRLDELLRHLPQRPSVERVALAATIDTIEQRIQWLDVQLSYAPETGLNDEQARRLWRERVDLMDSLVKVRYAEGQPLSF
ncbi:MAG TPA: hypothetical protein VNQ81_12810 [Povalibacter sp.]|nr:hypothetical protein [Povalibacter sp.]